MATFPGGGCDVMTLTGCPNGDSDIGVLLSPASQVPDLAGGERKSGFASGRGTFDEGL